MMGLRDAYYQKADAQLREWLVWIEQIKERSDARTAKRPAEHQRSVERLEDSYRSARVRLDVLRSSNDEYWENAKQAVEQAMIELKRALDHCGAGEVGNSVKLKTDRSHRFEPFYHQRG